MVLRFYYGSLCPLFLLLLPSIFYSMNHKKKEGFLFFHLFYAFYCFVGLLVFFVCFVEFHHHSSTSES